MTEDSKKQDILLETTDCLEAIGTLKSNKNLHFFVCLLCLLILQVCFWLMFTGHVITNADEPKIAQAPASEKLTTLASAKQTVTVETESEDIEQAAQTLAAEMNMPAPAAAVEPAKTDPNSTLQKYTGRFSSFKISFSRLAWIIRFCNYLLVICSVTYAMTLLFGLKISLVGRLGGISHVTKAFFVSLFMIVVLLPWQIPFRGIIVGAIFAPSELLASRQAFEASNIAAKSFVFLRYTGFPAVVILLLVWAQLKSMRWSRNTLKRLGIVG